MATIAGAQNLTTNTQIDQLIEQYRTQKSKPVKKLEEKITSINKKIGSYGDIKSKLNTLMDSAKALISSDLTSPSSPDKFESKTVSSSDSTIVSATATSDASNSTYEILVTRLAKSDSIFSNQVTSTDTTIVGIEGAGAKTFSLTVNGTTSNIVVTLNVGDTNSDIIKAIASAINSSDANVTASAVSDTATTSRLLISSKNTGTVDAISFADVAGTLFDNIGLSAAVNAGRTAYTNATAGFQYTDSSTLNASFKFNGVDMTRGSNTITDLIDGITFTLKKTQLITDTPITISTTLDKDSAKSKIDKFITDYNDVIKFLNSKTARNSNSDIAGDSTYTTILSKLRSIARSQIESISTADGPDQISLLGIKVNSDGTLSFDDVSKFNSYLDQNVRYVADIFVSTDEDGFVFEAKDGLAHQFKTYIDSLTKPGGQLALSTQSSQQDVRRIKKQITKLETKIEIEVQKYRDEFSRMQTLVQQLGQQYSTVQSLTSGLLSNF
ncbi:MAG: flagellar filament capping protein FliD [Bacteroidota bacterium]